MKRLSYEVNNCKSFFGDSCCQVISSVTYLIVFAVHESHFGITSAILMSGCMELMEMILFTSFNDIHTKGMSRQVTNDCGKFVLDLR